MITLMQVQARLTELGIPVEVREGRWLRIAVEPVTISIESRPHYCDRGRFIVKASSHSYKLSIDGQDGFPRYYFGVEACATEIAAWMKARGLDAPAPAAEIQRDAAEDEREQ